MKKLQQWQIDMLEALPDFQEFVEAEAPEMDSIPSVVRKLLEYRRKKVEKE